MTLRTLITAQELHSRVQMLAGEVSHAYDDGVVLPNFNDGYVGTGPDRGAHEDGTADMDFGTTATGS